MSEDDIIILKAGDSPTKLTQKQTETIKQIFKELGSNSITVEANCKTCPQRGNAKLCGNYPE